MIRNMRRALAVSVVAVAALGTFAACGGSDAGSAANGAHELVVYSPQGDGPRGAYIAEHAKAELGIDVTFVSGGGGELTDRLVAEKNNSQADVVLGLGAAQLYRVAGEGVLDTYAPAWSSKIPAAFQLADAPFSLFSQTPIVIAYNAEKLPAVQAPRAWTDLARPEWKNKFVLPSLESQTGQAVVVGILMQFADNEGKVSDEGWNVLKQILQNAVPVPEGAAFDWAQVKSGARPLVINWLGGITTGAKDNKLNLEVVDTTGGTPYVNTGVGLVKGTDHADDAKKFIDWFGSADFQAGFVKATGNDTPINPDALKKLPEAVKASEGISPQEIDWKVASANLTAWLQKIQLEIGG